MRKIVKLLVTGPDTLQRVDGYYSLGEAGEVLYTRLGEDHPVPPDEAPPYIPREITGPDGRLVVPRNGAEYLECLQYHFSGTAVRATRPMAG